MIAPGFGIMSVQLGVVRIPYDLSHSRATMILTESSVVYLPHCISCFITNGLAVKFGKRPVFIGGNLVLFISSLWASFMNSFNALLASRIFGCIGISQFEVLVTATITDMYPPYDYFAD